ncbi:MAG TPA: hypothetical protein VFW87_00500 [Pirellulales bacterium]|nr:hypothetical protein [Pirellulales bacterium]
MAIDEPIACEPRKPHTRGDDPARGLEYPEAAVNLHRIGHVTAIEDNPYRSPQTVVETDYWCDLPLAGSPASDPPICIKPHLRARGVDDFCIGFLASVPSLVTLLVLPAAVALAVSHSLAATLACPALLYVVFFGFVVSKITLTAQGIRFHRLFGTPKFLPWDSIASIEIAPRRELITKGWLPFPLRELSPSRTSVGHYRISWGDRFYFYPPADPKAFEYYVRRHLRTPLAGSERQQRNEFRSTSCEAWSCP